MKEGFSMLPKEQMVRINELAKKSKTTGLTDLEAKEQSKLRKSYLETFRSSMLNTLTSVKIVDPKGTDVTPQKLKDRQNKHRLH